MSKRSKLHFLADWMRVDCADTSVIRTKSGKGLLYARSQVVLAAKAFDLEAIDMVM